MENYRIFTGKGEAHKAFNTLRGIVSGISIDSKVNQLEADELNRWVVNHEFLARVNPFDDIITNVQEMIDNRDEITEDDIEDVKWLFEQLDDDFNYYDRSTTDLQVLQGIAHGILSDGVVKDVEVTQLEAWLREHEHLASYYPYDEICSIITEITADGRVDETERKLLKRYFNEFVNLTDAELQKQVDHDVKDIPIGGICAVTPDIQFDGKTFCFTGASSRGTKAEMGEMIEARGGIFRNTVSKKTDYLVVGDNGNPCWSYACYGRKVEKAIHQRRAGGQILIVHENDFWDEVAG